MKYAINYNNPKLKKILDNFDEITITYQPSDTSLIPFLQKHSNQRINIAITDENDFLENDRIKFFISLKEEYPEIINYVFKMDSFKSQSVQKVYDQIATAGFDYFFNAYLNTWDDVVGYLNLSPTDIYIAEELGFELKTLAKVAHERGTAIRVFPNVAQSSWPWTSSIMQFFIRPEDTSLYEPYVDTFEFYGNTDKDSVYIRIYQKDKVWAGDLSEIIIGLHEHIDSRCLLPNFGIQRLNCGKRCVKGRPCHICATQLQLSNVLSSQKLTLNDFTQKQPNNKLVKPDENL